MLTIAGYNDNLHDVCGASSRNAARVSITPIYSDDEHQLEQNSWTEQGLASRMYLFACSHTLIVATTHLMSAQVLTPRGELRDFDGSPKQSRYLVDHLDPIPRTVRFDWC